MLLLCFTVLTHPKHNNPPISILKTKKGSLGNFTQRPEVIIVAASADTKRQPTYLMWMRLASFARRCQREFNNLVFCWGISL